MCGRYSIMSPDEMQQVFGFLEIQDRRIDPTVPRFNVAPTQLIPVVVQAPDGRRLVAMRWGFRPAWLKDPKRPPPINARSETLLERPMFRGAVRATRCLIPADGFYEWRQGPGGKQPMHIRLRGGGLFAFAGLFSGDPAGPDEPATCAIITTAANELMAQIHERMPVILPPESLAAWLDPAQTDPAALLALLQPYPADRLEAYPVSTLVNNVRNDGPELVRPQGAEKPGLFDA